MIHLACHLCGPHDSRALRLSAKLTFVRNRGELAEGWYDPATLQKAQASAASQPTEPESRQRPRGSPKYDSPTRSEESSDDDLVGPTLPGHDFSIRKGNRKAGPAIPDLQDLELKRGILSLTKYTLCECH